MAQILENEYCNKCNTFNLTEEFHLARHEVYCTNCGFEEEFISDDFLTQERITCKCGNKSFIYGNVTLNENAEPLNSNDNDKILVDSESVKTCQCSKCKTQIEFI